MSSFTPPTQRKDYRLDNYRTCKICGDDVNCGVEGMVSHMQSNHSLEEIATKISFQWQPDEPKAFHHPNGTAHFYQTGSGALVTTMCGLNVERHNVASDESQDEWFERLNYQHVDAEDYCGRCVNLYEHNRPGSPLPAPLED